MDISSGISSYFNNTEFEAWSNIGCFGYLAKTKPKKLHDTVGRSLQRAEVTSFFERLDKVDINATESLTNATENLYESKLKDDSYIENTDEDDCSSKCETIISEEDKQQ
ncbi:17932_t:CDS:2, partial [Gigaspora margarita]